MTRRRPRRAGSALLVALGLVLGGCAIGADETPRDIDRGLLDGRDDDPRATAVGSGDVAVGPDRIFLLAPAVAGVPNRLVAVARDVAEDPGTAMTALFAGPNAEERKRQLRTEVPTGLRLLGVFHGAGGLLVVDMSREILGLSGDGLIAALAQIVFTATDLDAIDSVQLVVEGRDVQWPASGGELRTGPLTPYDYPGWDASSQPPYPGFPDEG